MDNPDAVATLVAAVEAATCDYLRVEQNRLAGCSRLLERFTHACSAWENGRVTNAKAITETVNELLVAKALLQDEKCERVAYEPALVDTGQTIDFVFHTTESNRIYYDVKTVHPERGDSWQRYERAKREGWFSDNTQVLWEAEWGGAELAHNAFASREKFLEHSLNLETKIVHAASSPNTYFRMVFCGDGFTWHRSELEDFADTYFGRSTTWDHFAKMERHFIREKGIVLARNIHGFCYFERQPRRSEAAVFLPDVRGPELPHHWRRREGAYE